MTLELVDILFRNGRRLFGVHRETLNKFVEIAGFHFLCNFNDSVTIYLY